MKERYDEFSAWLVQHPAWATSLGIVAMLLAALVSYWVVRRYLLSLAAGIIRKTEIKWDDALLEANVLRHAASTAPWLVIYFTEALLPNVPAKLDVLITRGALALLVGSATLTLNSFLTAVNRVYARLEIAKNRPIKGYLQVAKLFAFLFGGIMVIAVVLDKSPLGFLAGVGAMTAVLLLIFRDTLLSLVASVQIASNDMVRIGDWIEMPKYGADGEVIDVALHTIKVQNWDKTITTIPTFKLIEDSFKNWRGMSESGGRRIKRAVYLDMSSVRFLDDGDMQRFSRCDLLSRYMAEKKEVLESHNEGKSKGLEGNSRRLTNLGTFRRYLVEYLMQHSKIHPDTKMTLLVRQREPGPEGLPIEIYAFTNDTRWTQYEDIQSDIFDHVLAIVPEFGLRVFQNPTGADLHSLATRQ